MKKVLFGLAKNENQAVSIVDQFKVAGFPDTDISVLYPERTGPRLFAHREHTKALEGAAVGAAGGVVIGAAFGVLVGIGILAIPGLAPLLAAGPIIAAFACAGGGAVVGGVAGGAVGMEIPEFEVIEYNERMNGGILLSVHTADATERDRAAGIFRNAGAVTAAEAVVDQAHGKPAPSTSIA